VSYCSPRDIAPALAIIGRTRRRRIKGRGNTIAYLMDALKFGLFLAPTDDGGFEGEGFKFSKKQLEQMAEENNAGRPLPSVIVISRSSGQ